ncbi:tRNA (N6-threonylcarbamoyladenosine(37)-N6)-methyltransferase TrmO (plasmid) [Haloplanus ruber]|uniref:tRNA (N6-threonylcarbamoyladenosine(37)-N6)-methyltransferase TrmO n=1 Tax=Haloplanus ruber TaxID=869892 RepID=A0ABD6CWM4_9EURY
MSENQFVYEPIGVIRTPFESPDGMPIQPVGDAAAEGTIGLREAYVDGLKDLNGFTHCILLYHFHESGDATPLEVEPFLDDGRRGVFATRAPQRPNRIGLSVVEIESVTDDTVIVNGIDVVDRTPLLDIKPFVPDFDVPSDPDTGWLTASESTIESKRADRRFL